MYLDAVETAAPAAIHVITNGAQFENAVFDPWAKWTPTAISHHGRGCCETAREWLAAIDFSALNGGSIFSGPRWLRQRFEWGPTVYPIHWCEIDDKKKVDCGVHAALAYEIFTRRGVKAFRAQIVQQFSSDAGRQWHCAWTDDKAVTDWINDHMIYHEACVILAAGNRPKLWDPSAGSWIDPKPSKGYGSLRAIRIAAAGSQPEIRWGAHSVMCNEWTCMPA